MRKYCTYVVVFSFLVFISIGCKRANKSPVIARVGNSVLTLDDLYKNIPPEYSEQITREQNINYVKQWIDTELLFREAMRRKIDRDSQIKDRLEKMKKDLLSAEMISRYTSQRQIAIDDNSVHQYYAQHKNEFIRTRDMVKYLEITVDNLQTAQTISRSARSDNFLALAEQYSKQSFTDTVNLPYVPVDELQPELGKAITATPVSGITSPVKTELGYQVVRVIDKLDKGTVCKEEEVWEEIVNLLTSNLQKDEIDKLLSDLRLKNDVQFDFDLITGSSGQK
jgi:parvulin-like peptidyl-prolyl isomerase